MTVHLPKLAVLGVGTMGAAMAGTAVRSGIPVVVWDRRPGAAADLATQGAQVARSVANAVEEADVVITMVTNADAVVSLATDQGLVRALRPGAVWAQMSTIGIEGTERALKLMSDQRPDTYFVDAPVSGSKVPAEQGKLLIFASGPDDARPRVAPVFDAIGQRTLWLGPAGAGSRMKLVNNVLLAFTAEGVANSFALAHRLGLEAASVIEAFDGGPLVSPWESGKFRRIAQGEYSEEFSLALALKDVRLALSEAGPDRFPVLAALAEEWAAIVDRGLGQEDVTVVTRALAE
ncbi:MAG TPA: NAD(P)-dependent oxidoreductase [Acidimicrobiales bacterium]|nr:NAD(P)-dependent oxidoreductase [Acidimicrobiales bacterium]